ncbi:DNA-binding MarR family transcriptional regulator [Arthrobacter roseus]|nr:DNA-binding MarR family transcriptional regulator [Arthrobacter roseus]
MPNMDQWPTGRLLSTAARLVEHAWNERLSSIGVTHAGVIGLGVLADEGPMTQARLAQNVHVQAQTMGKTLARLENHGHVSRVRNDLDRRSHMVSITAAGTEALTCAHDVETTIVEGDELLSEELRAHLFSVIRGLAVQQSVKDVVETTGEPAVADIIAVRPSETEPDLLPVAVGE